jgi:hypothetical protein
MLSSCSRNDDVAVGHNSDDPSKFYLRVPRGPAHPPRTRHCEPSWNVICTAHLTSLHNAHFSTLTKEVYNGIDVETGEAPAGRS